MNTLSQIGKQLGDLFSAMTPQARIMAGLMVGVIVVSLGWILTVGGGTEYETLLGASFTERELDRMESAFGEAGLRGYNRVGRQMKIPIGEKDLYLKALSSSGAMPAEWGSKIQAALEAGSVFDSPSKMQMRFDSAAEQEFATLLMQMNGIEWAAVEYDKVEESFLKQKKSVCSVWVRAPMGRKVETNLLRSIAKHTMKTFAGLTENDVSVMDVGANTLYDPSNDVMSDSPYLTEQMRYEEKLENQIFEFLGNKYGDVQLMVAVELDPTLEQASQELTYDGSPVALRSTTSRKDTQNEKSPPAGAPGTGPNQDRAVANTAAQLSTSSQMQVATSKESSEETANTVGHTTVVKSTAGLTPTKLTVNLAIPDSHIRKVWEHQTLLATPDTKPEELEPPTEAQLAPVESKITAQLQAALEALPVGLRGGQAPTPYVTVTTYADTPVEPLPEPSMMAGVLGWLTDSWSTLALLGILVVGLAMMSSWVKSVGESQNDKEFAEGFGLQIPENLDDELDIQDEAEGEEGEGGKERKVSFEVTGEDVKEDVSTLIKENPDAAVNLLKTWIGDAA